MAPQLHLLQFTPQSVHQYWTSQSMQVLLARWLIYLNVILYGTWLQTLLCMKHTTSSLVTHLLPEFDLPLKDCVCSTIWMKPQKVCITVNRSDRSITITYRNFISPKHYHNYILTVLCSEVMCSTLSEKWGWNPVPWRWLWLCPCISPSCKH